MVAYDEGAADRVILVPIARGIQGEGLNSHLHLPPIPGYIITSRIHVMLA